MAAVGWEPNSLHYSHFYQSWPTVEGSAVNHILDHTSWLMFRKKKPTKTSNATERRVRNGQVTVWFRGLRESWSDSCPWRRWRRGKRDINGLCWGCGRGVPRAASKNCGRKGSCRAVTLMPRTMKAEGPEEGISRKAAFAVAQLANRYRI